MQKHKVSIIAAIDEKRGLGKDDDLLFKIKEDFKRMQQLTIGHPIIMGRKTHESKPLGRLLPKRTNIIVTRDKNYKVEGAVIVGSLEEAIQKAEGKEGDNEIFIFGGGQIFKEAIDKGLVDRIYLTIVKGDYGADTFFPEYKQYTHVIETVEKDEEGYEYRFLTLEK